jgi:mannose-1-phosphate guanylyltransferase
MDICRSSSRDWTGATPRPLARPATAGTVEIATPPEELWAVVLAGGEGLRLRPLTEFVCGDHRPKQDAPRVGSRSLLRQTLDRVALAIPPERTVVVGQHAHAAYLAEEFRGCPPPHLLLQPGDRGTAAGVLLPAHWISWRDPDAVVAVFPSDHFVHGELAFMRQILEVARFTRRHPDPLVLMGAMPRDPETQYGWIEPGPAIGWAADGPVHAVRQFREKPDPEEARACLARGDLWNTFVLAGAVTTLLQCGWQALPGLSEHLASIEPFTGADHETWAMRHAYARMQTASFSRHVLEPCPSLLAVCRLAEGVLWADAGRPERVMRSLREPGATPRWLRELEGTRVHPLARVRGRRRTTGGGGGERRRRRAVAAPWLDSHPRTISTEGDVAGR